jgi:hypothetical protein
VFDHVTIRSGPRAVRRRQRLVLPRRRDPEPGERPEYHDGYYGAFILDLDGHNVEVVNHNR